MNKNNKIDDLNMDNEDSFEDFSFGNVSDIDEKDEKNIKLNALLELDEVPDPPSFIKENLLKNYCKEFRYRILWTKFKDFLARIIYIDRLVINERLVFASVAVLFILITAAYYQYIKPENSPTNIISNQKTPIIPIIKLSPNPNNTPIAIPSPIESIDPKVAINPNNDNIRQDGTKEENNQQAITNQDTKPHKPEESKGLDKENDKIAMTTKPKDNRGERNIRDISKKRDNSINRNNSDVKNERLTLSNLVYVAVKDLKIDKQELNIIDIEIKDELIKAINDNGKWELSSEQDDKTQAIFYKQNADGALVLFDKKERTPLWEDLNYIENYKKDKNYIKSIVKMLENHKDESPQKK